MFALIGYISSIHVMVVGLLTCIHTPSFKLGAKYVLLSIPIPTAIELFKEICFIFVPDNAAQLGAVAMFVLA
jgi:hypothetical protein